MNKVRISLILIMFLSVVSCKKKPSEGEYAGVFYGKYFDGNQELTLTREHDMIFTDVKGDIIVVDNGHSSLTKHSKDSVSGVLDYREAWGGLTGYSSGPIEIKGILTEKNSLCLIKGTFTSTFSKLNNVEQSQIDYELTGSFEITAKE